MRAVLAAMAAIVTRWPVAVLVALGATTVALAALASTLNVEVDLTQLGREDSQAVQAMDRVREEFGDPTATVQVIVDAGPGASVLTASGLQAMTAAEAVTVDALAADLREGTDTEPAIRSVGTAVRGLLAEHGADPAAVDDAQVAAVAGRLLQGAPQLATLLSDDLDVDRAAARAAVLVAFLDPRLDEEARTAAGERVRAAFDRAENDVALAGVDVTVFSSGLFTAGLLDAVRAEVPLLFGLALLVVIVILVLAYRSLFDVALGLVGLVATVAWTFGFVALLGPGYLGWRGPLSQLGVIVPVLLVGLGIDYSVHLTARYRAERAAGEPAEAAASGALRTVGAALVLATAATAAGFATTATAPLPMVADFGVFVAVGVVCAFVVMGLAVPAARVVHDRRRAGGRPEAVRELGLGQWLGGAARLATRAPAAGLLGAAVVVVPSLVAATALPTEFDRDDFVPEGSDVEAVVDHQEELFGAGLAESTFVVVDGDLTDPALRDAVEQARLALGTIAGVRTVGGTPQAQLLLGEGSAVVQVRTTAGDAGAERLRRDVERAFAPVTAAGASVAVTSDPIIIAEMSEDLRAFQAQAIGLTLAIVLVLLAGYYGAAHRRPLLGVIAMLPAVVSASLILGVMWLLGFSFNVLTATLTAIAVGIGVPYGVHVVNRFVEDLHRQPTITAAVGQTLHGTGGALTGSALTTLGAFAVLSFSGLLPIRTLGLLGGTGIAFALLAALLVQPGVLVLWARRGRGDADRRQAAPADATSGRSSAGVPSASAAGTADGRPADRPVTNTPAWPRQQRK